MTTYIELPDFQNGDIASTSRLNAVARNIDVAVGLDEGMVWPVESGANVLNCGIYSRASDARFGGDEVEYYMAHNGDRLYFYHVLDGYGCTATLTYGYDQTGGRTYSNLAHVTAHNLELPNFPRYKIVRVRITGTPGRLFVRQLYGYDSNAQAIGTMPAFTNGATSDAGDLNDIMAGTKRAFTQLNQPIAGMYSVNQHMGNYQLTTDRNGYYGYIRHKHNKLRMWIDARVDGISDPNNEFTLSYNNAVIWRWNPYTTGTSVYQQVVDRDLPGSLTVGNWYPVEFRMEISSDVNQRATIWALYEYPSASGATVSSVTRWTHGDKLHGDAEGPPQLDEMTDALGSIATPLRWTNPACRAATQWIPNQSGVCNGSGGIVDEFASYRVHRWLAYENIIVSGGEPKPVTLQYQTSPEPTLAGETLPAVTVPSYYDLDNTPIKPGMYFRLVGSKYCIQTPGYEGQ